jgi:hypothetical protein
MPTANRVGRDGFTGSPITLWCPSCEDWVIERGTICVWCEGALEPRPKPRRSGHLGRDEQARLARERKAEATRRMRRMYEEGRPLTAIALATGVDRATVARRLAR